MKWSFHFCLRFLLGLAGAAVASHGVLPLYAHNHMPGKVVSTEQDAGREKRERTPAQRKIDSQLLYALYRERGEGEAKGVPSGDLRIKFDEKGRALVSVRARVTRALLAKIKSLGGDIVSSSVRYNDIRAHLPLRKLEELAALKEVHAIMPAEEATTNSTN